MSKSLSQRNRYLKQSGKAYSIASVASSTAVETGKPIVYYIRRSLKESTQLPLKSTEKLFK